DKIAEALGRLDVVVNNAGYVEPKLFLETTPEEWRRQVDVCLYGVFNTCHAAAPKLAAQKGGRIISIVGDSARVGQQRLGVSAGARGAVLSLTRTLAKQLGRHAITVNALPLGWLETSHADQERRADGSGPAGRRRPCRAGCRRSGRGSRHPPSTSRRRWRRALGPRAPSAPPGSR